MSLASVLTEILPVTVLLMVFAIVGSVVILRVRKSLKDPKDNSVTFSLSELKKLRDNGSLSEEEFEKAKQAVIDGIQSGSSDILDENG